MSAVARTLGDNVLPLMDQRGLTRADMLTALGVKQPTFSEQLGSSNPQLDTLFRYATILECPVASLIDGIDSTYDRQRDETDTLTQLLELAHRLTESQQALAIQLFQSWLQPAGKASRRRTKRESRPSPEAASTR
jgi:transcriptional regulator with XRE-family HTH domain